MLWSDFLYIHSEIAISLLHEDFPYKIHKLRFSSKTKQGYSCIKVQYSLVSANEPISAVS